MEHAVTHPVLTRNRMSQAQFKEVVDLERCRMPGLGKLRTPSATLYLEAELPVEDDRPLNVNAASICQFHSVILLRSSPFMAQSTFQHEMI